MTLDLTNSKHAYQNVQFFVCPDGFPEYNPGIYVHLPALIEYVKACGDDWVYKDSGIADAWYAMLECLEREFAAEMLLDGGTELKYDMRPKTA